jgi:hypothetical protein
MIKILTDMKNTIDELNNLIETFSAKISSIPDPEFSAKPLPKKWSKKEVLGHLIDSGQNNLRRFVVGQYEPMPPKITYEQDFWVASNGYQKMEKESVIRLWKLVNQQISQVLGSMPVENYDKQCDTGHNEVSLKTLEWLAQDYVKHMKHHLNQIIPGSFEIVYN